VQLRELKNDRSGFDRCCASLKTPDRLFFQIGAFAVQSKHRTARMQGEDYDVPDVRHVLRRQLWDSRSRHRSFGTPVSHGCVNLAVDHAEWLFEWATIGTPVVVHD
jgi:hypothetical protein